MVAGEDEMQSTMQRMTFASRFLALMVVAFLSGCRSAASKGQADAKADLKVGKLVIEQYGLPTPVHAEAERLLRARYGIEARNVAGCIVNKEITEHAEGYNRVMKAEIARRFGADVFERTYQEVRNADTPAFESENH